MSGIIAGINYNLLFGGSGSTVNASDAILTALYGGSTNSSAGQTTFVSTGDPITDLKLAQQEQTTGVAAEANQPQVASTITQFTNAVNNATSIQNALLNPSVQQVLLTANGLSGYIGETSLVQKAFLSDPTDSKSLVNQLGDSQLLSTVQSFNFAKTGLAGLQDPKVISTLTNAYTEVEWRIGLDQATPGLSEALDFISSASSIKSITDVLANQSTFNVITGALGIPQSIVNQDTTAITQAINSKLDYAKLQDPTYVTNLTDQYLLSLQGTSSSSSSTDLTSLAVQAGSSLLV